MSTTVWSSSGVTPSRSSDCAALARERRREVRQDAVGRLDEQDARRARVDRAEVAAQRVARDLGDLPGQLDARRPGADDDERQPRARALGIRLDLGGLERASGSAPRMSSALSSDLRSGANGRQSSWPKYE